MLDEILKRVFEITSKSGSDDCPDTGRMAAYLDDRLTGRQKEELEAHLARCERCLEEVSLVTETLTTAPRVPGVLSEGFDMVVRFLGDTVEMVRGGGSVFPMAESALAPARAPGAAGANTARFYRDFEKFRAEVEVERFREGNGEIRVKTSRDSKRLDKVRVSLVQTNREVASYLTDSGRVLFEDVRFGRYTLRFRKDGQVVGDISLKIEEDL